MYLRRYTRPKVNRPVEIVKFCKNLSPLDLEKQMDQGWNLHPTPLIPPPPTPPSHDSSRDTAVRSPVVLSVGFEAWWGMGPLT